MCVILVWNKAIYMYINNRQHWKLKAVNILYYCRDGGSKCVVEYKALDGFIIHVCITLV